MVWPETLSRTPWLINKLAGGPPFRTLTFEIGFSGSRCGAISALTVSQGHLGAKDCGFLEISANQGVAPAAALSRMLKFEIACSDCFN